MHPAGTTSTVIIVAAVLLFFLVGVAMMVIMDHKARLPGGFTRDPFTIHGMRRDHPVIAFLTAVILLSIIVVLIIELAVTAASHLGMLRGGQAAAGGEASAAKPSQGLRRFHQTPGPALATGAKHNACFTCHGDFPHAKERMVSNLLNMHSQFTGCMTCHLDPKEVAESEVVLRWLNYSGIDVQGPPFGTDVNPATGLLVQTDDYYSRIVPYRKGASGELLLERLEMRRQYHRAVSFKGPACDRCHTDAEKSLIPYRALGFSEQRVRDLTSLNLVGLVDKYEKFYFPAMRGEAPPPPKGSDAKEEDSRSNMARDPEKWWEQTYGGGKGK